MRKTGALSTKNGWPINYANSCESEETYFGSDGNDIVVPKLFPEDREKAFAQYAYCVNCAPVPLMNYFYFGFVSLYA